MLTARSRFADRTEAGRLLAEALVVRAPKDAIVYALPRGGVPVALEIARALDAPLDLALVRKIGAPGQPELALAAVVDGDSPHMVVNEELVRATGVTPAYLEREKARELAEIERRRRLYLADRPHADPKGRTAIIVDDGLATGATALAAIEALRARGVAKIILAVPVAPPQTAEAMRAEVDEFVCLAEPAMFWGVGGFYDDFHQLTDSEVVQLLREAMDFGRAGDERA
jgi:putative phosphoribosyl transferase